MQWILSVCGADKLQTGLECRPPTPRPHPSVIIDLIFFVSLAQATSQAVCSYFFFPPEAIASLKIGVGLFFYEACDDIHVPCSSRRFTQKGCLLPHSRTHPPHPTPPKSIRSRMVKRAGRVVTQSARLHFVFPATLASPVPLQGCLSWSCILFVQL